MLNLGLLQTSRKLLKSGRERSEKLRGHNSIDYKLWRIHKIRGLNQPISKRKLDELNLYPMCEKVVAMYKQLAVYPKKKILSNFLVDNHVFTGKDLAQKLNYVSFTQDIRPLNMSSQSLGPTKNSIFSIPSQFIIDEKDVILSSIPTNKSPGTRRYPQLGA